MPRNFSGIHIYTIGYTDEFVYRVYRANALQLNVYISRALFRKLMRAREFMHFARSYNGGKTPGIGLQTRTAGCRAALRGFNCSIQLLPVDDIVVRRAGLRNYTATCIRMVLLTGVRNALTLRGGRCQRGAGSARGKVYRSTL